MGVGLYVYLVIFRQKTRHPSVGGENRRFNSSSLVAYLTTVGHLFGKGIDFGFGVSTVKFPILTIACYKSNEFN